MTGRFFPAAAVCAALILIGGALRICAQDTNQTADARPKETEAKTEEKLTPPETSGNIKVTFDVNAPGVLFIESNGEKIRIDANRKTVEQIKAAVPEKTSETQTKEIPKTETAKTQDDEESQFDFDSGEEPYDYRLINVPTPKKVPKGTWNLSFTHRFSQPIHPLSESGRTLLGFDSFSISGFGISYGITDKLYVSASRSPLCQRGMCRTIEIGIGYNWIDQTKDSPIGLTTYGNIEGNGNFTEEYNYNLQAMISGRVGKRVYLFFSPAVHLNANGQKRFNPRPNEFFPPAVIANDFRLPKHAASFGFGTSVLITPSLLALFDFTPRIGFKHGRVDPIFGNNFNVVGFKNVSQPSIGFGIQKNIGKHSFALTFSNTQATTTSRYNSSNLVLSPRRLIIGFNLFRRF